MPAKLVHKIIFSMPAGTPPDRLLAAVRDFAEKEYAPKHRYALALHTDEPHPHVHVVMKSISEDGERLNIRKATLRAWRKAFARHLRNHGVASKATQRSTRGKTKLSKLMGIYRPVRTPHAFPQKVAHAFVKVRPPNFKTTGSSAHRTCIPSTLSPRQTSRECFGRAREHETEAICRGGLHRA